LWEQIILKATAAWIDVSLLLEYLCDGEAQIVARRANRKVAKPWFEFPCGSASLYPWSQTVYCHGGPDWQKTAKRTFRDIVRVV